MRIFQTHDYHLDVCRSFLVISMIFTHVFEMFYIPDYNRRLTYFVTIGFVLLSGFVIGAIYKHRILQNRWASFLKLMFRTGKLILLFIFCNTIILLLMKDRLLHLSHNGLYEIIRSVLLGTTQKIFGFDILIPIALTTFFSFFILKVKSEHVKIILCIIICISIVLFEEINFLNYYGTKLLLSGIVGCLLGAVTAEKDWKTIVIKLEKTWKIIVLGVIVLIYYIWIIIFTEKGGGISIGLHVVPTIFVILFVYLLSNKISLVKNRIVQMINDTLGSYMLFSYLYHILIINILFWVIKKDSLSFIKCFFLAIGIIALTVFTCKLIKYLNSKSKYFNIAYDAIFRL